MSIEKIAPASEPKTLADDRLRGVKAIASYLGETQRRVFYCCEHGLIPCGREGSSWVASKRALRAHFEKITGAAA